MAKKPHLECLEDRLAPYDLTGFSFPAGQEITYSVASTPAPGGMSQKVYWQVLGESLDLWAKVAPLRFRQVPSGGMIQFDFAALPTTRYGEAEGGQVRLANAYPWQRNESKALNLNLLVAHEVGHTLGLGHSGIADALMHATYRPHRPGLHADDIAGIRAIYGAGTGSVTTLQAPSLPDRVLFQSANNPSTPGDVGGFNRRDVVTFQGGYLDAGRFIVRQEAYTGYRGAASLATQAPDTGGGDRVMTAALGHAKLFVWQGGNYAAEAASFYAYSGYRGSIQLAGGIYHGNQVFYARAYNGHVKVFDPASAKEIASYMA